MTLEMKSIGEAGELAPLGSGLNTIRKFSEKYASVQIGDLVDMLYLPTTDDDAEVIFSERLQVRSVAVIAFKHLWASGFVEHNHGDFESERAFEHKMKECYGRIDDDDPYIVIQF